MERLSMRKIREVLRQRYEAGLSIRQVANRVKITHSSVINYERRFAASGLRWPLPEDLSDAELERRLYFPPPKIPSETRPVLDWAWVHEEMRRPGVTLHFCGKRSIGRCIRRGMATASSVGITKPGLTIWIWMDRKFNSTFSTIL